MNPLWEQSSFVDARGTFIRCKNCATETRIYQPQNAQLFCCPKCHKVYSRGKEEYNALSPKKPRSFAPALPLYTSITLKGTPYTLVGCALKREKSNILAKWEEYTLVDEQGKYAFLSQSNGHWLLLKERTKPEFFEPDPNSFLNDDSLVYEHFTGYYQLTNSLAGEFPYDAINVKNTHTREYIAPPFIFTAEHNGNAYTYFEGEYIKKRAIKKGMPGLGSRLPVREGIGSCQPFYFGIHPRNFTVLSLFLVLITLPFYFLLKHEPSNQALASVRTQSIDTLAVQKLISPSFEIFDHPAVLRFDAYSPLENDWAEAEISLMNETSGEERYLTAGLEYYHGTDDEGPWSEGDVAKTIYLSHVQPGRYHIEANITGSRGAQYTNYQLVVYEDFSTPWNYWICIGILAALCGLILFGSYYFEKKRNE